MNFNNGHILLSTLLVSVLLISGCRTSPQFVERESSDNLYRSHTGSDLIRNQLKDSFDSVIRIQNHVSYRTYIFDEESLPTRAELSWQSASQLTDETVMDHHSTAGTGIVISDQNNRIALVTASHTVSFPDTLWHFAPEQPEGSEAQVQALSVQQSTTHFVYDGFQMIPFEMLLNDSNRDIAVLYKVKERREEYDLKPLQIELGTSDELDWTDKIYAVGYPKGVAMITSGMISYVRISPRRNLVMDASFNRGYSGGAIFAIRTDGSGLEWVGMVTVASAEEENYLAPEQLVGERYEPDIRYDGPIYVQTTRRINYGITFALDIDEIRKFINENRSKLENSGVRIPRF